MLYNIFIILTIPIHITNAFHIPKHLPSIIPTYTPTYTPTYKLYNNYDNLDINNDVTYIKNNDIIELDFEIYDIDNKYILPLIQLCRPKNIPIAFSLPIIGSFIVNNNIHNIFDKNLLLLCCINSIMCSYSMAINDLYDSKRENKKRNPIVSNKIPFDYAKNFVSILFILNIFLIYNTNIPSIKLIYIFGLINTTLYTSFFKPITLLKNISVASTVAIAPLVGAIFKAGSLHNAIYNNSFKVVGLITSLLLGNLSREILLDVFDINDDKYSEITTIPIKYGIPFSIKLTMLLQLFMTISISLTSKHRLLGLFLPIKSSINLLFILANTTNMPHSYIFIKQLSKQTVDETMITSIILFLSYI